MHEQSQTQNPTKKEVVDEKIEFIPYIIEISFEQSDCGAFMKWLNEKGHQASIINSECCFVNGMPSFLGEYYFIYNGLYSEFLAQLI